MQPAWWLLLAPCAACCWLGWEAGDERQKRVRLAAELAEHRREAQRLRDLLNERETAANAERARLTEQLARRPHAPSGGLRASLDTAGRVLEDVKAQLQQQGAEKARAVAELQRHTRAWDEERASLAASVRAAEAAVARLSAEMERLTRAWSDKRAGLEGELDRKTRDVARLTEAQAQLVKGLEQQAREMERLKAESAEASRRFAAEVDAQTREPSRETLRMQARLAELDQEDAHFATQLKRHAQERARLDAQALDKQAQVNQLTEQGERLANELGRLKAREGASSQEWAELRQDRDDHRAFSHRQVALINSLKKECERAYEAYGRAQDQLAVVTQQLLEAERADARARIDREHERLAARALEAEMHRLAEQNARLTEQNATRAGQIARLRDAEREPLSGEAKRARRLANGRRPV